MVLHIPSHNLSATQVHPHTQVLKAAARQGYVGDITHPHLVGGGRKRRVFEQVRTDRIAVSAIGRPGHKAPGLDGFQAAYCHEPAGLVQRDGRVLSDKFSFYPSSAIASLILLENRFYFAFHDLVFGVGLMCFIVLPLIVTAAAQSQGFADQFHGIGTGDGGGKAVQGGYVVRLKIAKAFFKISRSISVLRSSALRRSSSAVGPVCEYCKEVPGAAVLMEDLDFLFQRWIKDAERPSA